MKLFFIATAVAMLSFSGFVQAQLSDYQFEFCQEYAEASHGIALLRDEGYSMEEIRGLYDHQDEDIVMLKDTAAEYVFTYPHLSPRKEANAANEDCRNTFIEGS